MAIGFENLTHARHYWYQIGWKGCGERESVVAVSFVIFNQNSIAILSDTCMHWSDDADNFFWHIFNISPKVEVDLNCTLNQRLAVGALQLLYCSFFCMPFASVLTFFLFWIFLRTSEIETMQIGIYFFAFTLDLPKIQRETNKNHETYRIVHKNNRNNWSS